MGGCVVNVLWMNVDGDATEKPTMVTVTPAGMRLLSFLGRLPEIQEPQVKDKSKADWLAKSVVCVQAAWMVTQVFGRLIQGLPVSLLEINTCGHVFCALALYLLWWSKPFDVQDPTILKYSNDVDLLFLCSPIGGFNDGIPHIRCFYYNYTKKTEGQLESLKSSNVMSDVSPNKPITLEVELGIGSWGNKNIPVFVGPLDFAMISPSKGQSGSVCFTNNSAIASECEQYLSPAYIALPLRHGDILCRRAYSWKEDTDQDLETRAHIPLDSDLISKVSKPLEEIWEECKDRQEYRRLYFTKVLPLDQVDVGTYVNETEYLVKSVNNFPALWNLSLGQVDIQKDLLPSILAFTALAYGGLHLSAWNDFYPSRFERASWVTAALVITVSGAVLLGMYTFRKFTKPSRGYKSGGGNKNWLMILSIWSRNCLLFLLGATFILARIFIVVEAFISLRLAPKEMYLTPEWSDYFPHL